MEKTRHRKCKSASGIEGIQHIQKQKTASRLSSDSRSYTDGNDMFKFDFGQSHFYRATGTPIRNLLEQEMSQETEPKKRSPSVIAKLMGLEGQPSPLQFQRQQQKKPNYNIQRHRQLYSSQSSRKNSMDHQEFKDVYEDVEASHFVNSSPIRTKPELLEANTESLKVSRKPNSSFFEHFHNQRVDPSNFLGGHIAVLKLSNSREGNAKSWKSESDKNKQHITFPKREDGLLLAPRNRHRGYKSRSSSNIDLEEKNDKNALPTRIVILKPNLGKMKETQSIRGSERTDSSYNARFSKQMPKGAREIAREITRRMREGCDESSYDAYESNSDSEIFQFSSRNSFDDNNWRVYPSSTSVESSVDREAKRRLSERWKTTQRYQDMEITGKGSTLGEMLSTPDRETKPKHLNSTLDRPLGISSMDGWKSKIDQPLSGTRSRRRRSTYQNTLCDDKQIATEKDTSCKEKISLKSSRSRSKKHVPYLPMFIDEIDSSSEEASFEIQMEGYVKNCYGQHETCISPRPEVEIFDEHGSTIFSTKSRESLPEQPSSYADTDQCLQEVQKGPSEPDSPSLPFLTAEPDSSESSKGADHSPVSVLKPPFDAPSSSKSFESVRTELHDLRVQLQLLKIESGAYSEVSSCVPVEKEVAQLSPILSGINHILAAESWKLSYALDVLIDSGLDHSGFDTWHTTNCPLDFGLFDNLEKKYSGENLIGSKTERKLLFDSINSALFDIFHRQVNSCPWVMPKLIGFDSTYRNEGVQDVLEKLIKQEFASFQISEKVLDREMQWSGFKGEINVIGNEIEKLLLDDMINELVTK